jgi:hypothetical protein
MAVPEPRIDRALTLQFQGDWGQANLHRICGWLSQEVGDRCGEGTRIAIWSGRGGSDAIHAVARGQVDIESWGGRFVEAERPNACVAAVRNGTADAIIHEAVMTAYWHDLADAVPLNFLTVEPATLAEMQRRFRWPAATLPAGYFTGLGATLETLEFSDFLMVARADMPDELAYLIAWCMCERRELIERAYRHIPPARSPVTYPLEPAKIARTPIELHPGARRYYRDAGVI